MLVPTAIFRLERAARTPPEANDSTAVRRPLRLMHAARLRLPIISRKPMHVIGLRKSRWLVVCRRHIAQNGAGG